MSKIILNIDDKLKKEFQENCKQFGVDMTSVIIGAIKNFNTKATTTKQK